MTLWYRDLFFCTKYTDRGVAGLARGGWGHHSGVARGGEDAVVLEMLLCWVAEAGGKGKGDGRKGWRLRRGCALDVLWVSLGYALVMPWICFGNALVMLWMGIERTKDEGVTTFFEHNLLYFKKKTYICTFLKRT